jgi:hypothetical protein
MFLLVLLLSLVVFYTRAALAQQSNQPAAQTPACAQPEHRQFDFWIGEWNLTWGKDSRGTNSISFALDRCVVVENFDGAPSIPLKGMSVSTFNARSGKWQQTWVDNQGGYLDFVGEFKDGRMVLQRKAMLNGKEIMQRMVFYNITKDQLDWNWERSQDEGKTWQPLWQIHYTRKK